MTKIDSVISSALEDPMMPQRKFPIRILHVLGGMDCGGVETWLMHVLRNIDRQQFRMDFLVHTDRRCFYDDEIESFGSRIHYCPTPAKPWIYRKNFLRILHEYGPYDVVHSHVHSFSAFVLRVAAEAGVRNRIAHSHCNTTEAGGPLHRRLYQKVTHRWMHRYASTKLAASGIAADSLFGAAWQSDSRTKVLPCGLDFTAFGRTEDHSKIRAEFGLSPDDFVIGHVGRFIALKNHDFLLKVHAELLKIEPKARLLLVGTGELEQSVRSTAEQLGIAGQVRFAGVRTDVSRLMLGAMNVFILPSLHEGLGLVAVEAQAAGLPTILSDQVPAEADLGIGLVRYEALQKSLAEWAQLIVNHSKQKQPKTVDALMCAKRSSFSIEKNLTVLCQIYCKTH